MAANTPVKNHTPCKKMKSEKFAKMTVVTRCNLLSLAVIGCHSLSLVLPLIVTCYTTHCHLLSLAVIRGHSLYHSLSLDVSFVVSVFL